MILIRIAITVFIVLGMFLLAAAEVPRVVNYQGRLVDDNGAPVSDGYYNLTFTLYDHATETAGHDLWTSGEQSVAVTSGLFTYSLGSNNPFATDLTADSSLWLGITLTGETEMTPRTQITTVPYAFHALSADEVSEAGDNWLDEDGDTLKGTLYFAPDGAGGNLSVSNDNSNLTLKDHATTTTVLYGAEHGSLYLYNNSGLKRALLNATFDAGGHLDLYNPTNVLTTQLSSGNALDSLGGYLLLDNSVGNIRAHLFGDENGGVLDLYGVSDPEIILNAANTGNSSVVFPDDAIASNEILNEPGVAATNYGITRTLTSTTCIDIETVTINIPEPGYIVVTAKAWGLHSGTTGRAYSYAQIDEDAGGGPAPPYYTIWGASANNVETRYESIFVQRVYYKEAGEYTFRLEAAQGQTSTDAAHRISDPVLIATYYPTSYGDMITMVSSSRTGEFDKTEYTASSRTIDGETEYIENNVRVNLRELEIKAKQLQDEIEQREMELERTKRLMEEEQNRRFDRREER